MEKYMKCYEYLWYTVTVNSTPNAVPTTVNLLDASVAQHTPKSKGIQSNSVLFA